MLRYMYSLLFCILLHVKITMVYDYYPVLSEVITFFHKSSFKYFRFSINLSSVSLMDLKMINTCIKRMFSRS